MTDEDQNEIDRGRLFIVGLNVDAQTGRRRYARGELECLAHGVYIDASLAPSDRHALINKNAVRIATKIYPSGVLAGSSAYHTGAVEGNLLLAVARGGKAVDVGGVFTIFVTKTDLDVGLNNEVQIVEINDSFGPSGVKRIGDEMLILRNFYPSKTLPRATYLNNMDLNSVVTRAIREQGGRERFDGRIRALAKHNGLSHFINKVMDFADGTSGYSQQKKALQSFDVYWHQSSVASLSHDGHIWNFEYKPNIHLQLSINEAKGKGSPPSFMGSLLPEVGVPQDFTMEDNLGDFKNGQRYISNITVKSSEDPYAQHVILDILDGELKHFRSERLEFLGQAGKDLQMAMDDDDLMNSLHRDPNLPRMSGMQVKIAANLNRSGELSAANGKSFTHIIKVVGRSEQYMSMCSMEWFSLTIAKACGLNVEEFAIANIGGHGPALIVERFDIRRDLNDRRMILTEDFWSIAGFNNNRMKYNGDLMNIAAILNGHSTDIQADARQLLSQAVLSWLTWNGDMHLKNLMLQKETRNPRTGFESVRLSPAYDMMCTQVYPNDAKSAAISISGSRHHTLAGFRQLGKKMGVSQDEVDSLIGLLVVSIPMWAKAISESLPKTIAEHKLSVEHIQKARDLFDLRCMGMLYELDQASKKRPGKGDPAGGVFSMENESPSPVDLNAGSENSEAELRRHSVPPVTNAATRKRRP